MSSTKIDSLIDDVQRAFDERPMDIEQGLDVEDAALVQFKKACRLLAGAETLLNEGYYTLVIESSFGAIERTIEFRLLERGEMNPQNLPGSHTGIYREAATVGLLSEHTADDLTDLWSDYRAKTYYQDGIAAGGRAKKMYTLATEMHAFVVGRSSQGYECICDL